MNLFTDTVEFHDIVGGDAWIAGGYLGEGIAGTDSVGDAAACRCAAV